MSDWQRRLRLQPEWDMGKSELIPIQALAGVVANRLKCLLPFGGEFTWLDEQRDDLVTEFETLASDASPNVDWFDAIMDELWDWGDTRLDDRILGGKKACWIDTISNAPSAETADV